MEQPWQTLQKELENRETPEQRRLQIGDLLEKMIDPRTGVGVEDGIPDIAWLPVAPGGEIRIAKQHFNVEPFYIARYLVTDAQYQAFVEADDEFANLVWWQGIPEKYLRQALDDQQTKSSNHPRNGISWFQSVAFSRWMNHRLHGFELPHPAGDGVIRVGDKVQVRLPTEWEWQWAAQNGRESLAYPWRERSTACANTSESGLGRTIAVGMYPHGAAACGAMDMAGTLEEWCSNNVFDMRVMDVESDTAKVLRGGDYAYGLENSACTYRDGEGPSRIDILNGCRLVLG